MKVHLRWAALAFLFLSGVVFAQDTVTIDLRLFRAPEYFILYVPGNQPVSLSGLGFQVNDTIRYLEEYNAFRSLNFEQVTAPACFVFRQTVVPLPQDCQNVPTTNLAIQILFAGDVFWYNPNSGDATVVITKGLTAVSQCPAGQSVCEFEWTFAEEPLAAPTPSNASASCVVSETMNLLSSPDTDGDGYSDFEESCILGSDAELTNRDSDGDGPPDEVESALAEINPAWASPNAAGTDRDGDWLFDTIELDLGIDPVNPDTDGDLISDFLEFRWLQTDPRDIHPDLDFDGFPDVLESWLPENHTQLCQVNVTLTLLQLQVIDPEEADSFDIIEGDEPSLTYGLDELNLRADNRYRQAWTSEGIDQSSQINNFNTIPARTYDCGKTLVIFLKLIESDAPFGGMADLGEFAIEIPLIFHRIPFSGSFEAEQIFTGFVEDGSYDYRLTYRLEIVFVR